MAVMLVSGQANSLAATGGSLELVTGFGAIEFFDGYTGNIAGLAAYLEGKTPTRTLIVNSAQTPTWENGSNYGARFEGLIIAAQTGLHYFTIASDDQSYFYLSTDETAANLSADPLAQVTSWTNQRQWTKLPEQTDWNGVELTAGKRYYFRILQREGGGGDGIALGWTLPGEDPSTTITVIPGSNLARMINSANSTVTISQQPQGATALQSRTATFTVGATGASDVGTTVSYQWQSAPKGSTSFTDISGATGASYTTPVLTLADDGSQYRVVTSVPGKTVTSSAATLTVGTDTTAPAAVSAGAVKGASSAGIAFNELLDPASAETASNYTIAGNTVTAAKLHSSRIVELTLSGAIGASLSITVNGVKDLAGNAVANATVAGEISDMQDTIVWRSQDTDPIVQGSAFSYGNGGFYVAAGGSDIWDNQDACRFVYKEFTGPFDVRARVTSLQGTHQWAKATLMARESLQGGSRHADVVATRSDGNGQNQLTWQWRDTSDGGSGSADGALRKNLRNSADYPDTWLRLVRADVSLNTFRAYWSKDGVDWNLLSERAIPETEGVLPEKLFVGMAVTSHDNGDTVVPAQALYESFSLQRFGTGDTTAPKLVSAGVLAGSTQVGLIFDEALETASAKVAGNYKVAGATVSEAVLLSGRVVQLTLGAAVSGTPTVTVTGVKDQAGNAIASATATAQRSDLVAQDLGISGDNPLLAGTGLFLGDGGYFVKSGGNDLWGNADGGYIVYREFTGAFDARVRVDSIRGGDEWAKASIMARESLEPGSRNQAILVTKPAPYESNGAAGVSASLGGVNVYNHQWRDAADGSSGSKAGGERKSPTVFPSWIRLVRESATSNEMKSYLSSDGVNWTLYHTRETPGDPLPEKLIVGLAVTSHDNSDTWPMAEVIFNGLSVQPFSASPPKVTIAMQGSQIVISWDRGTLVSAPSITGPYAPVTGASPLTVTPSGASTFYSVRP